MIEVGSYWAYYSLWFASQIKEAKNYLIEPDPRRLEVGKENFKLNNKTGKFYRGFVGCITDHEPNTEGAEYFSISDFIKREQIEHVNIMHADIQGAELEMLSSCIECLDKIDYFFISTHDDEAIHEPCLRFFQMYGWDILAEHTIKESCSGDGLIVAKRKDVQGPKQIPINKY